MFDDYIRQCSKCGSTSVTVTYTTAGVSLPPSTIWSGTEFVESVEESRGTVVFFTNNTKKEHLLSDCDTCHFVWRERTLDAVY